MFVLKKKKDVQSELSRQQKSAKAAMSVAAAALAVFVAGGLATFSGLGCFFVMKGRPFLSFGDGRTFGMLLVFGGLFLSIFGVLMMRISRNRMLR